MNSHMECRIGCAACCIAPSISSSIPGMEGGKPAGVRCVQLSEDNRCRIFGSERRPGVCSSLRPNIEMCGCNSDDAMQEALLKTYRFVHQIKEPAAFRTWLYRLASNHILNFKKKWAAASPAGPDITFFLGTVRPDGRPHAASGLVAMRAVREAAFAEVLKRSSPHRVFQTSLVHGTVPGILPFHRLRNRR